MDNQGIFKTCIVGGFEKESVLNYLEELSKKSSDELEEKQNEIDQLVSEKSELEDKVSDLSSQLEDVTFALNKEKDSIKTLNKVIASVNVELEKAKQQSRKIDNEKILLTEKYKQLKCKYDDLSQKENSFNDVSVKLGSLLLEAQKTGEAIIANANSKSQSIKQDTQQEVKNTMYKLESFKNDFGNMRGHMETVIGTFKTQMDEIESSIDSVLTKSKKVTATLHDKKQSKDTNGQQKQNSIKTVRV